MRTIVAPLATTPATPPGSSSGNVFTVLPPLSKFEEARLDMHRLTEFVADFMDRHARCAGEQGTVGEPLCCGPDIRAVRVSAVDRSEFSTRWCADCRAEAQLNGYRILEDLAAPVRSVVPSLVPSVGQERVS